MELLFKLSFYVINKKNILSLSSLKNMKNEKKSSHLQLQKFNPNELDVLFKFDEWNSCKRGQRLPDMNVILQIVNQW